MHIIDSVAGSDNVTLHFYAPQVFASNNFHVTVCAYGVNVLSSAVVMKGKLADCKQSNMNYFFRKVKSVSSSNHCQLLVRLFNISVMVIVLKLLYH